MFMSTAVGVQVKDTIDDAKEINWNENNMHFDRIDFGDDLEKIVYRIGKPDETKTK